MSEEIVPAAVFYATITPVCVWFLIKKSIIEPMNEERKNIELQKTKRNNEHRMALKKEEARAAIELMEHTYERIVAEETSKGGIVIQKAIYGKFNMEDNNFEADQFIDVTIPLQCLIKDKNLMLYKASKVRQEFFLLFSNLFNSVFIYRASFLGFMTLVSAKIKFLKLNIRLIVKIVSL